MWDLLGPGSPALAGGFLTTTPPGKSLGFFLILDGALVILLTSFSSEEELGLSYVPMAQI